ncbi:hypothetical protein A3B32_03670 [Candidatus Uhrbacteria bacterium RIFCSPLOWO2_01_FULL_53_9]|uniref:Uncharacterized protein n=1 Tax=Candidatus Uhrbacteria bacterium RIFCSPLOWO2_01_FULL_53_9 TaxID=1802403 RepID=A0A1F7UZU8_9BACT|nr:MAG: hypothetical protein A3B32_03670 [Candidatus Uhrbacteria bacterium RIFCSPLOWO2_01_FULL_53_9]
MRIEVSVIASARTTEIVFKGEVWKVKVQAAPDKGKANEAVRALIAKELGVPKSCVVLLRGAASRKKVFEIRI